MANQETNEEIKEISKGPYWEDAVYQHLSRQHRSALTDGNTDETERVDELMQAIVNQTLSAEHYWQLEEEARADRKKQKQARKERSRSRQYIPKDKPPTGTNVAELKKRIYNHQVSKENMIKAIEALPPAEKKATLAGLPPGLIRKLGDYIK